MLGGGLYRHSCTLISGNTGTGKSTLLCGIMCEAARRGERTLFSSAEESDSQLIRDMAAVSIDLKSYMDQGLLKIWSERPRSTGIEERINELEKLIEEFKPRVVALDGIGSLNHIGNMREVNDLIVREIDLLRSRGIQALLSVLSHSERSIDTVVGISSVVDTWIQLKNIEHNGEQNRLLSIIKSRGSYHSNQVREFRISSQGPELVNVAVSPNGVLIGSARLDYEDQQKRQVIRNLREIQRKNRQLQRQRMEKKSQIELLSNQLQDDITELELITQEEEEARTQEATQGLLRAKHRGEFDD